MTRITVDLDDELVSRACEVTGIREHGELLRSALTAVIAHESALRLAKLGGSDPDLEAPPRRHPA